MNIEKINKVVATYFEENTKVNWIPAKIIMYYLVQAEVFTKDVRNGLPLRKVLRKLDAENQLDKIPLLHAERVQDNTYWYFVREGEKYVSDQVVNLIPKKERGVLHIENSDEFYLVNLCDELLKQKASRKHTFDNLLGNMHKKGKGRTKLPLAAYYENLKLAIDFKGKKYDSEEREERLRIYGLRKKEVLERKKIKLILIDYTDFECDENQKLVRNETEDMSVLKNILKNFH